MSTDAEASLVNEMLSHLKSDFVDYDPSSQVADFYANRTVFITGATGYIGKILVEKLLRSCKDIKRIYILLRAKHSQSVKERFADFNKTPIFDRLLSQPNASGLLEEKLHAIEGDITFPKFGIAQEDMEKLSKEVSIVFNGAASIRFKDPLDEAVRSNICNISHLVDFCDDLENLQALIHISTAYSNCNKKDTIREIFYEPPMRGEQMMSAIKDLKKLQHIVHINPMLPKFTDNGRDDPQSDNEEDDRQPFNDSCLWQEFYHLDQEKPPTKLLDRFTLLALGRWNRPNTYTFTKAIAEGYLLELVQDRPHRYLGDKIPVAILRPPIVTCTWREPFVGFVDNFNGASGSCTTLYTGVLQALPVPYGGNNKVEFFPVDMLANTQICIGWFLGQKDKDRTFEQIRSDKGVYLFNCASGLRNPVTWEDFRLSIADAAYKYPTSMHMRLPNVRFMKPGFFFDMYDFLNQRLPAIVLDFIKDLFVSPTNNRRSLLFFYNRMKGLLSALLPFGQREWKVSDTNARALYEYLSKVDKDVFEFDVNKIDWTSYLRGYVIGIRIFALKDDPQTLPGALRTIKMRQLLQRVSLTLLLLLVYFFFYHQSQLEAALVGAFDQLTGTCFTRWFHPPAWSNFS